MSSQFSPVPRSSSRSSVRSPPSQRLKTQRLTDPPPPVPAITFPPGAPQSPSRPSTSRLSSRSPRPFGVSSLAEFSSHFNPRILPLAQLHRFLSAANPQTNEDSASAGSIDASSAALPAVLSPRSPVRHANFYSNVSCIKATPNQLIAQRNYERDSARLKERIKSVKPTIDTSAPRKFKHLIERRKAAQLAAERENKIQKENSLLVGKMKKLGEKAQHCYLQYSLGNIIELHWNHPELAEQVRHRPLHSWSYQRRIAEIAATQQENELIYQRLSSVPPVHRRAEWEKFDAKNKQILKKIGRYQFVDPTERIPPTMAEANFEWDEGLEEEEAQSFDDAGEFDSSPAQSRFPSGRERRVRVPSASAQLSAGISSTFAPSPPARPYTAMPRPATRAGVTPLSSRRPASVNFRPQTSSPSPPPALIYRSSSVPISGVAVSISMFELSSPWRLSIEVEDSEAVRYSIEVPFAQLFDILDGTPEAAALEQQNRSKLAETIIQWIKFDDSDGQHARQLCLDVPTQSNANSP